MDTRSRQYRACRRRYGYIAANKVAEDMGVTKWWKYSEKIEEYVKQYIE